MARIGILKKRILIGGHNMRGKWKKPVEDILKELEAKPKDKWTAFDFMVWGFLYCDAKIEEGIGMRMVDRDLNLD